MNEPFYIEGFSDIEDIYGQFEAPDSWRDSDILYARYCCECYEGDAWVVFEKNGALYEVNGCHCSCMGLEDQWDPEEVTLEALKFRLEHGDLRTYPRAAEFIAWLEGVVFDTEIIRGSSRRGKKSVLKFSKSPASRKKNKKKYTF